MNKIKFTLAVFLLLSFIFLTTNSVLALEVPLLGITNDSSITDYIGYFFGLAIALAGAIAAISLVFSGIQLMIGTVNPESATNAKDRIKGSVLGLILLMVSFLLMKTINPVLISPTLNPLAETSGLYYTNGSQNKPTSGSESNIANIPSGYEKLKYTCADPATAPKLMVWLYPETDFKGDTTGATTEYMVCNGPDKSLSGWKSFTTAYQTPGAYFYLTEDCSGLSSPVRNVSGEIDFIVFDSVAKKSKPIKSVALVSDIQNKNYYGIITHESNDINDVSKCEEPLLSRVAETCQKININAMSANIFIWNKETDSGKNAGDGTASGKSSGDGVIFSTHAFGDKAGARRGIAVISKDDINPILRIDTNDLVFDYTNSIATPEEAFLCKTLFQCQEGSIEYTGQYIVASYSDTIWTGGKYCRVVNKAVTNLKTEKPMVGKIKTIDIIATK